VAWTRQDRSSCTSTTVPALKPANRELDAPNSRIIFAPSPWGRCAEEAGFYLQPDHVTERPKMTTTRPPTLVLLAAAAAIGLGCGGGGTIRPTPPRPPPPSPDPDPTQTTPATSSQGQAPKAHTVAPSAAEADLGAKPKVPKGSRPGARGARRPGHDRGQGPEGARPATRSLGPVRGRPLQDGKEFDRLVEGESPRAAVSVRARRRPGDPRLGPGRGRDEGGRPPQADHSRGPRLRRAGLPAGTSRRTRR
jgi:hypothetical protein